MTERKKQDDGLDGSRQRRHPALAIRCEEAFVPMADGTQLATDLVVPDVGQPCPALLIRGPYSRAAVRAMDDCIARGRGGWAVVIQDCRGRFDSDGEFDPFRQERRDGADTIGWVAAQPWCDGRVATYGPSYLGVTQLLAALEKPAPLKAIAPVVSGAYLSDRWMHEGGAFELAFASLWAAGLVLTDPNISEQTRTELSGAADDPHAFLRSPAKLKLLADLMPAYSAWQDSGAESYWDGVRIEDHYHEINVPGFHVAGWYDLFAESTLETYAGLRRNAATEYARTGQRLVIGPWTHIGIFQRISSEFDFGPRAMANLPGEVMNWLRDAMDGKEIGGDVRAYIMSGWGQGEWREFPDWPPPSETDTWYLSSSAGANGLDGDGVLTRDTPATSGEDGFVHDPADPVPTRGGRLHGTFFPLAGPMTQQTVEERTDVLVYTSETIADDLLVIGAVTADIYFETSSESADLVVKLCDVYPDGRSYNVLDSVRRIKAETREPRLVRVALGSIAQRFLKGHRLRVQISSSNFPRFDCNPAEATAHRQVQWGGDTASRILLPVVAE